jgi:hypothetical protein
MTNEWLQFLSLMIMPVGALIFAGIMLFVTRHDRRDAEKKR